jgi:hypothetical protein
MPNVKEVTGLAIKKENATVPVRPIPLRDLDTKGISYGVLKVITFHITASTSDSHWTETAHSYVI